MKKLLARGGILLGVSAIISKLLGLWRDRLFLQTFESSDKVDLIFASFRIPDFFFFLLIGGTVSTLFLPRIADLKSEEKTPFFSSFLWLIVIFFGITCGLGTIFTDQLITLFAGGFDPNLQIEMIPLARCLFGSVFLLSISSVFAAFHQSQERFLSLATAPILYTGTLCLGLFLWQDAFGLMTVGLATLAGAGLHLFINAGTYFAKGNTLSFDWLKPPKSWKGFQKDFLYRVLNNSSFQINQSADVLIASFLLAGSVTAFSLGTNTGLILLSIIGLPIANAAFPRLAKSKHQIHEQKLIVKKSLFWIAFFVIPASIIGAVFSKFLLHWAYNLDGQNLEMATTVFWWTVISLPFACAIPIMSRVFLANDDTKTPLRITAISLLTATGIAAIFSLWILPPEQAILGLAWGNFTANTLSALLFGILLIHKFKKHDSTENND
jgi:putative peptidoglycan lipid II flippase